MKKIIGIILMMLINPVFAYSGFGICNHGKETIPSVVCYGPTVLSGTTITHDIKIAGELKATKITVGASMNVAGEVEISDSTVEGTTEIVGSLNAKKVIFRKGITIETDSITFTSVVLHGSLLISSKINKPYLRMYCSTTITGSVTFADKPGVIEVSEESIVQGKVINGTIHFVKKSCD